MTHENDAKTVSKNSWWSWTSSLSSQIFNSGVGLFQLTYTYGKLFGWAIVTTGMITALPLVFEVKREGAFEDMEQAHIAEGLREGLTPRDLAQSGYTSAVEPSVLK